MIGMIGMIGRMGLADETGVLGIENSGGKLLTHEFCDFFYGVR